MTQETQEIITTNFQHGFVFNYLHINFNEEVCKNMLSKELTSDSKRELFQTAYIHYFIQKATLISKSGYGQTDVQFGKSIMNIKNYIEDINNKIKNNISQEEFNKFLGFIEEVLDIEEKEKEVSTNIVAPYFKKHIGL